MKEQLEQFKKEIVAGLEQIKDLKALTDLELDYFGRKKGKLNLILKGLKDLPVAEKKEIGGLANQLKDEALVLIEKKKKELEAQTISQHLEEDQIDLIQITPEQEKEAVVFLSSLKGALHPLTIVQTELEDIFKKLGFMVLDGPELESDYYNFEALNFPPNHPARDDWDTFYIKSKTKERLLLRPHTSPVQVRGMQKYGAPVRAVVPGRCFRYEALDASHENTFNQLEGLMVDENISINNLIAVMKKLLKEMFQKEITIRLRPGFFPFVEPAFELDMQCLICGGKGCSVCKHNGWVEVLPCGMVHPNVLKAGNVDPKKYSGFAFGLGLTRLVMMRYGVDDIRLMNSADLRFLKQF